MKNIAIFASGKGTNAENIIKYFKASPSINVAVVISNNASANVINRAKRENVNTLLINRDSFYKSNEIINTLKSLDVDLIVLAGFLWLIPESLILSFPNKIINIHPALLPKFGGKNMYGMNVHEAVVEAKEKESGITIHYVNEKYDDGEIISQHTCNIGVKDTPEVVAQKIHQLELEFFPKIIEKILL